MPSGSDVGAAAVGVGRGAGAGAVRGVADVGVAGAVGVDEVRGALGAVGVHHRAGVDLRGVGGRVRRRRPRPERLVAAATPAAATTALAPSGGEGADPRLCMRGHRGFVLRVTTSDGPARSTTPGQRGHAGRVGGRRGAVGTRQYDGWDGSIWLTQATTPPPTCTASAYPAPLSDRQRLGRAHAGLAVQHDLLVAAGSSLEARCR